MGGIALGIEMGTSSLSFKYISETYDEIEKIEKNESDSYYKEITDKLCSFFMSDNFLFSTLYSTEFFFVSIYNLIAICDSKEKFLFFKILFPLLDQLKKNNFENQLEKLRNSEDKFSFEKEKEDEEIIKKLQNIREKIEYVCVDLNELCLMSFIFIFKFFNDNENKDNYKQKILKTIYDNFKNDKDSNKIFTKDILDILNKLNFDSLVYTNELYQLFVFGFKIMNSKDISKHAYFIFEEDNLKYLLTITDLNKNYIWIFVKENKPLDYDIEDIVVGKKNENVKFSLNVFLVINNDKEESKNDDIVETQISKSFINDEEVVVINIDELFYKHEKISFEELKNKINKIINKIHKNKSKTQIRFYIKIGLELQEYNENYYYSFIDNKIEELLKNKDYLFYDKVVNELSSFFMSPNFVYFLISAKDHYDKLDFGLWNGLYDIIRICELSEECLFLKCLFPLLERLKENNFENQLFEIYDINRDSNNIEVSIMRYIYENNILKRVNNKFDTLNESYINNIISLFCISIFITFELRYYESDFGLHFDKPLEDLELKALDLVYFFKNNKKNNKLKNLIKYYESLNQINYSQNVYQIFIFILRVNYIHYKEQSKYNIRTLYNSFYEVESNVYKNITDLNECYKFRERFYLSLENDINQLTVNRTEYYYDDVVDKLCSFFMSNNFINFLFFTDNYDIWNGLTDIIEICDANEEFLFLKCLFPLFEKLKQQNFENQFNEINKIEKMSLIDYIKNKDFNNNDIIQFFEQEKMIDIFNKFTSIIETSCTDSVSLVKFLFISSSQIFFDINNLEKAGKNWRILFIELFTKETEYLDNCVKKEQIKNPLNFLLKLNSLNYTKELYELFLFAIGIINSQQKISDFFFLEQILQMKNQYFIWLLFDGDKYEFKIKKKNEKEKLSMNVFKMINNISGENNNDNQIKSYIYQSTITNEKIILIKIENLKDVKFEQTKKLKVSEINNNANEINLQSKEYKEYLMINYYIEEYNENYYNSFIDNKIEELSKNKDDLFYDKVVNELSSFFMSPDFIHFLISAKNHYDRLDFGIWTGLYNIVRICELSEEFLFLKCLFPLLERLKENNFENQINIIKKSFENYSDKELNPILLIYDFFLHSKIDDNSRSLDDDFIISNLNIFMLAIDIIYNLNDYDEFHFSGNLKNNFIEEIIKDFNKGKQKKVKNLLEYYNKTNSFNFPQEIYQLFIFCLEMLNLDEKQMQKLNKNEQVLNELFESDKDLDKNYIWSLIEDDEVYAITGKKNLRTNLSLNIFERVYQEGNNNDKINKIIYQSLITNEIIIMIKLNNELKEKRKFEEVKDIIKVQINEINKIKPESKNYKVYILLNEFFIEYCELNYQYLADKYEELMQIDSHNEE